MATAPDSVFEFGINLLYTVITSHWFCYQSKVCTLSLNSDQ